MTLAMSTINASLRVMYEDNSDDPAMRAHALYAWMDAEEDFLNEKKLIPVKMANPRGTATTLAAAQAAAVDATVAGFTITKTELFNAPKIKMELVEAAASGNADEFFQKITNVVDGAKDTQLDVLGRGAYRSAAGVFSRVKSGTSSPIIVTNPQDLYGIEVGEAIVAAGNADMSSPRTLTGTGMITGINLATGEVSFSGTFTSLAVGDYLALASVTSTAAGLLTWSPATGAPSDTLFGQTRSTANARYTSGRYLDLTNETAEGVWARIGAAEAAMGVYTPDIYTIHPEDMANMQIAATDKKAITGNKYNFGWDAITVRGKTVLQDNDCPRGYIFGVPKSYKRHSLGQCPKVCDTGGDTLFRVYNEDACEARVISRFQYASGQPYAHITAAIPT